MRWIAAANHAHLGYEKYAAEGLNTGNSCNGKASKKLKRKCGEVELVKEARKDAEAFYEKGNKAAGTRLRKAMQEARTKAQDIRKEVTDKKNKE